MLAGTWRLLRVLAKGGMGTVYEAENQKIGKRVAVKVLDDGRDDASARERFLREAKTASRIESPEVVEVFDVGTADDGTPFLVMELLRGETLGQRLRRVGRLSAHDAVAIVSQCVRGLVKAHEAGVIHRDLKPDNLFLVDRGDDAPWLKILDFGISKVSRSHDVAEGTLTRDGVVLGTPHYLSPEQAMAEPLDARSDLFSVGTILFECLTGQPPTHGIGAYEAVVVTLCTKDAPDVRTLAPETPAELAALVKKVRSLDREQRHASAEALLRALRDAMPSAVSIRTGERPLSSEPVDVGAPTEIAPTKTTWANRDPRTQGRPRSALLLGASAVALAFVVTVMMLRGRTPEAPRAPTRERAAPTLTMRVVTPPGAIVKIDGKESADRVVRGEALSEHDVVVELPSGATFERRVRLDGSPELVLGDEAVAAAPSASGARSAAAVVRRPVASASASSESKKPTLELKVNP